MLKLLNSFLTNPTGVSSLRRHDDRERNLADMSIALGQIKRSKN